MIRFRPRRWLPLLRVLVLASLALGLVLQPVLVAAGELHELAHDPSGMHTHGQHAANVTAELAEAGEQNEDGAQTLHVVLDFAHCCGTTAALLPTLKLLPVTPVAARMGIPEAPIPLQARLTSPFKPPIFE